MLSFFISLGCLSSTTSTSPADSGTAETTFAVEATVTAEATSSSPVSCQEPARTPQDAMVELTSPEWLAQTVIGDGSPPSAAGPRPTPGLVVADFDDDGWLDIFLPASEGPDQLFMGGANGELNDQTETLWPGTGFIPVTSATAVDIDNDGDLDLFLTVSNLSDRIYLNDGLGLFTRGPDSEGPRAHTVNSTWADVDGDGDLDAFVSGHLGNVVNPDAIDGIPAVLPHMGQYLENLGDNTLADASAEMPEAALRGYTTLAGWHDLDGDSWPDLYVVNDFGSYEPNVLIHNDAGSFSDVSEATGTNANVLGMGLGVGFVNDDTTPDLLVTSWSELVFLESVQDGTWMHTDRSRGLQPTGDSTVAWGAELFDVDNDGDLDAVVAFGSNLIEGGADDDLANPDIQPDMLFLQGDDGRFIDVAEAWGLNDGGIGRGVVVADLDRNGWLDVIKRDLAGPTRIYLASCGAESWLNVSLQDSTGNHYGIGARIDVYTPMGVLRRSMLTGGTSMGSSAPPEVHFGLGDTIEDVDVVVTWPDGEVSVNLGLSTQRRLTLTR